MNLSMNRQLRAIAGLGLLLSIWIGAIAYQSTTALVSRAHEVTRTHEVLENVHALLANLNRAESAERAFLLTGDERYRYPLQIGIMTTRQSLQNLSVLTAGDTDQQRRLEMLAPLSDQRLSQIQERIKLRATQDLSTALQSFLAEPETLMPQIESLLGAIEQHERQLLRQREQQTQAGVRRTLALIVFGSVLGFLPLAAAVLFIDRDMLRHQKLEATLNLRDRALAASSNGITITDARQPDNPLIYVNPAFERFTGYTAAESLGRNSRFLRGPATDPAAVAEIDAAIRTGSAVHVVLQNYRKDGRAFWNDLSLAPVYDSAGTISHYVGNLQDITARRQIEEALRDNVERLRILFEQSPYGIMLCDPNDQEVFWPIVDCNAAMGAMNGYTREELLGRSLNLFLPADADPAQRQDFLEYLRIHGTLHGEAMHRSKDGSHFPIEYASSLIRIGGREMVLSVDRDISARKEAEARINSQAEELRAQTATLQGIVAASPDIISLLNATGQVLWNSPAVDTVLGVSSMFEPGTYRTGKIHVEDQPAVKYLLQSLLSGERDEAQTRYRYIHADGYWVVLEGRARRMLDSEGRLAGVVIVSRDVSAQVHLEAALRQAQEEAEQANRAKSEFLSRMSHELRTPLNAILGFGQLLEQADLTPRQKRNAGLIVKGGRHLLELINEVLDISRIEAGHLQLSVEPVAVRRVVQEALDLVQPLAAARRILLRTEDGEASDGWSLHVLADLQRLKQVLLNLLSNAIKYNYEAGQVVVACERTGTQRLRLLVRDTGPGILPEKLDRLFIPFDRLDAEHTRVEGTGLGLSLSRRLAEAMGGTLGVESHVGAGSTFWVELPLTARQIVQPRLLQQSTPQPEQDERACTILYLEDNLSNVEFIEQVLDTRPSVRLLSALQGRIGLALAREHHPDLILLDLHLPDMDGDVVLAEIQADPQLQTIPVVVLSADATPRQIQRLLAAGAHTYLTKPLDVQLFMRTLDEILDLPQDAP